MKNLKRALSLLVLVCAFAGSAVASSTSTDFLFSTTGLRSLDHCDAYTWGLNTTKKVSCNNRKQMKALLDSLKSGDVITGAVLTFKNIYNWAKEDNHLYVDLLDNSTLNKTQKYEVESYCDSKTGDYFAQKGGVKLYEGNKGWVDGDGPKTKNDLQFTFSDAMLKTLTAYLADGKFGIGIDPDCHYYDCGVSFRVTTDCPPAPVPEPCTLALFGLGLLAPFILIRRTAAGK